jgi:clathrin heavy chain
MAYLNLHNTNKAV